MWTVLTYSVSLKYFGYEKLKWLSLSQIAQLLIPKNDEKIVGYKILFSIVA